MAMASTEYKYDITSRELSVEEVKELTRWIVTIPSTAWYQIRPGDLVSIPAGCYRLAFTREEDATMFSLKWA